MIGLKCSLQPNKSAGTMFPTRTKCNNYCNCRQSKYKSVSMFLLIVFSLLLVLVFSVSGDTSSSSSASSSAQTPDSSQSSEDEAPLLNPDMYQYMDDDSAVRFITSEDDFVYDDEISNHHSDLYQQSFKHGNTRIALQQEKCPPLPEPSAVVGNSRLCEQKSCQTDEDCSRDDSVVCCYNGCIHSCLPKVNPPVAFDWVEETELKQFSEEATEENFSPRTLLAAELRPETVSLPGGCHVESAQYQDLIMFRKLNHVKTCNCVQGEVLCEVIHETGNASS